MGGCGGLIRSDGLTMLYLPLQITNPDTKMGISNLKDEIEKATLANFGKNVKDLLDGMSSNYTIIIDKGEHHEDVFTIFSGL